MECPLMLVVLSLFHINGHVCMDIIGGHEAAPHSRPYMAFLQTKVTCGGALIKPNWILTAAHCTFQNDSYALLGVHRLKDTQHQQKLIIKRGIKHPCYDETLKINDILLLELATPAKLNKFVAVIPLPKREEKIAARQMCSVAGWGQSDPKKKVLSDVLREANLTIIDNDVCKKMYSKKNQCITKSMICAGAMKKRKDDTCSGDSGGPLICNKKYAGIVSFGPACGKTDVPGVYTRLTDSYLKWIQNTIGGDGSDTYTV